MAEKVVKRAMGSCSDARSRALGAVHHLLFKSAQHVSKKLINLVTLLSVCAHVHLCMHVCVWVS